MGAATASDVLIMGGGLAGLTLALQLRHRLPELSIRVLERRADSAPAAAFKVGESTVEIGAHYFANVLGLREYLDAVQVRKFGFRFFFSDGCARLDRACELGVSRPLPTPSWQIERGSFENHLVEKARASGIVLEMGVAVRTIVLGEDGATHTVRTAAGNSYRTRWLIDASGRCGLLRRQLQLDEDNGHRVGAAWFRLGARLDPDAWCDNPPWRGRCEPPERWRSTNHLCGPGYWVWLISLASCAH
jgi:2-polyprenyl-6-methoxyphenol hydroxylase-like FAD-dependent oxidoreductase